MSRNVYLFLFFMASAPAMNAQCVQWLTGDAPVVVSDDSENDPTLWRATKLFDPLLESTDLAETTVQPTAVALRGSGAWCTGGQQVSAAIYLDLDGDGAQESIWRTGQVMTAGFWPWDNRLQLFNRPADSVLYHPGYVGAGRTSRLLPIGVQEGDTVVFTLWLELADGGGAQRVPLLLPYGVHRVEWRIDAGPSFDILQYTLDIRDGGAPRVECTSDLQVNLFPNGLASFWTSDALLIAEDNYLPPTFLNYGIRLSGTGSGFPEGPSGHPVAGVSLNCAILGDQTVELWVRDHLGNTGFCETSIQVNDPYGVCSGDALTLTTCVATPDGIPLNNVQYSVSVPPGTLYGFSQQGGCTTLVVPGAGLPPDTEICMTPFVPGNDPLGDVIRWGVTLFDALSTYRHILGIEPLDGPYKQIAADVNKSGSVTTFDIVTVLRMLTGRLTVWPNNINWRLIDGQFVFPNPVNPFLTPLPENGCFVDPQADTLSFVAIKTGDVDCSALLPAPVWPVKVMDVVGPLNLKAGDEATVRVRLRESARISGIQLGIAVRLPSALQWIPGGLSSELVEFGDTLYHRETATGMLMAYLPSAFFPGEQVEAGSTILSFKVKATSDVYLPDALSFGYKLAPELYTSDMQTFALEPVFQNELSPDAPDRRNSVRKEPGVVLFPNPADDVLTISHGDGGGRLLIADPLGRVVLDQALAPGEGVTHIQTGRWTAGAYTWSLLRGESVAVGRLVVGRP